MKFTQVTTPLMTTGATLRCALTDQMPFLVTVINYSTKWRILSASWHKQQGIVLAQQGSGPACACMQPPCWNTTYTIASQNSQRFILGHAPKLIDNLTRYKALISHVPGSSIGQALGGVQNSVLHHEKSKKDYVTASNITNVEHLPNNAIEEFLVIIYRSFLRTKISNGMLLKNNSIPSFREV